MTLGELIADLQRIRAIFGDHLPVRVTEDDTGEWNETIEVREECQRVILQVSY